MANWICLNKCAFHCKISTKFYSLRREKVNFILKYQLVLSNFHTIEWNDKLNSKQQLEKIKIS